MNVLSFFLGSPVTDKPDQTRGLPSGTHRDHDGAHSRTSSPSRRRVGGGTAGPAGRGPRSGRGGCSAVAHGQREVPGRIWAWDDLPRTQLEPSGRAGEAFRGSRGRSGVHRHCLAKDEGRGPEPPAGGGFQRLHPDVHRRLRGGSGGRHGNDSAVRGEARRPDRDTDRDGGGLERPALPLERTLCPPPGLLRSEGVPGLGQKQPPRHFFALPQVSGGRRGDYLSENQGGERLQGWRGHTRV